MKSPLIDTLINRVQLEFAKPVPVWHPSHFIEEENSFIEKECKKPSPFDKLNLRKSMLDKIKSGKAELDVRECEYGKVIGMYLTDEQEYEVPWELWSRILRIFHEESHKKFKVYFMANTELRKFPPLGQPIEPVNINGGYTYPCDKTTIVLYRAEDATRVLIHELFHACCLDKHENGVDFVEAETEAWAELIYIALLSQGKKYIFNALLQRQSEYMRHQNEKIDRYYKLTENPLEFPWRYTKGKELVWSRWGILVEENAKPRIIIGDSLRLTFPPTNELKKRFRVSNKSTIL